MHLDARGVVASIIKKIHQTQFEDQKDPFCSEMFVKVIPFFTKTLYCKGRDL